MKCQNCGKNETNFHFSSNVNGNVTQTHLCSECAAKSGYDFERIFSADRMVSRFFQSNMRGSFMPMPMIGYSLMPDILPELIAWPQTDSQSNECCCGGVCATPTQENKEKITPSIDDKMKKRREINVIREQMRCAAEKEDFEKAAELRDKIHQMEAE